MKAAALEPSWAVAHTVYCYLFHLASLDRPAHARARPQSAYTKSFSLAQGPHKCGVTSTYRVPAKKCPPTEGDPQLELEAQPLRRPFQTYQLGRNGSCLLRVFSGKRLFRVEYSRVALKSFNDCPYWSTALLKLSTLSS